jgi:hypothetical protein
MTLFMPNYIPSMLSHLCPSGCGSASSPAVYTPPVSYTDLSIHPSISSLTTPSTPVSPAEKTWIQQVVGSLLFYARALNLSLLTAVCQLSSHQFNLTQHDLSSAHRLLNYASSHSNPHKTIHPSSMALWACTDASSLSRPKSAVWLAARLGLETPHPTFLTHPRKSQTKLERQTVPCPSLPPVTIPPHTTPCYPQRPSPCLLSAHTRGGSVCGRGGLRCHFWR